MKQLTLLLLLIIAQAAHGQSLSVFDVDASNFPTMRAKFYAFDAAGNQIKNLSPTDFEIKENGTPRTVKTVSCPNSIPVAVSSVLVFDMSGSMSGGPPRIESAKEAANAWVDGLPLGQSECALVSFDHRSMILHDFTKDKTILKNSIALLNPSGGTNYDQALIDEPSGGLQIARTGKNKRVLIFLTDGQPNAEPRTQDIIAMAKQYQITIYAVTLDMPAPQCIKDMTKETGGEYFENITTLKEAEEIYQNLLQLATNVAPCEITWESGVSCPIGITKVELAITNMGLTDNTSYVTPSIAIANLEFNPKFIRFTNPLLNIKTEQKLTITAKNADYVVSNISTEEPKGFDINPNSFRLKAGESIVLTVSYTPTDSGYSYCKYNLESEPCSSMYFVSGGWTNIKPKTPTLKLTHPNGGDSFVVGSDTVITWEGIATADTVSLDYTIDDGINWKLITNSAYDSKYNWTSIPNTVSSKCKMRIKQLNLNALQFDLTDHTNRVSCVFWSPDGSQVATASYDGTAIIWDANAGYKLLTLSFDGNERIVDCLSWSPNGKKITTACWNIAVIWDAVTGKKLHILNDHTGYISYISWSPDGSRVATASIDNTAIIWDAKTGNILNKLKHYSSINDGIYCISWSPDGSKVGTASKDKTATIWDAATGKALHTLSGHTDAVQLIFWSPDGSKVATVDYDSTGIIWDAATGNKLHTLSGHTSEIKHISWSPDGSRVATASWDDTAIIWDAATGKKLHTLSGHSADVAYISWSPDGSRVATASLDRTAIIWDAVIGIQLQILKHTIWGVTQITWSPDGSRVATASQDNTAEIWIIDNNTIQEDQSDSLFSIVAPEVQATAIDMKECLVNSIKDSLVTDFIINSGTYKCRVDSIYFTGADASAFSLVSGIPVYTIEAKSNKATEFRFRPNRVGLHNAEIVIITQAETLTQKIYGEGVQPTIATVNNLIDFGIISTGEFKDSLAYTIKNIGTTDIKIGSIVNDGPNTVDFTIEDALSYPITLKVGDTLRLNLKFKTNSIGRTSTKLLFNYEGQIKPAEVILWGQAVGGIIQIEDDSAFAGERKKIKLRLMNDKNPKSNTLAMPFKAKIKYNPTLLTVSGTKSVDKGFEVCEVRGNWDMQNNILGEFDYIAALGDASNTYIFLEDFQWLDDAGNAINAEVEKIDGSFSLLGLCHEGGTRLVNPNANIGIQNIAPIPGKDKFTVTAKVTEADTKIRLIALNGKVITEIDCPMNKEKAQDFTINLSEVAAGIYFIEFKSATFSQMEKVMVGE